MNWKEAIAAALREDGRKLFVEVFSGRTNTANESSLALASARLFSADKARDLWWKTRKTNLPARISSLKDPAVREELVVKGVQLSGKLSGAATGYLIPQWGLKFYLSKQPLTRVVLPSLPLVTTEIFLAWANAILKRAAEHSLDSPREREMLERAGKLVNDFKDGIVAGSRARAKTVAKIPFLSKLFPKEAPGIPMTDNGYKLIEAMFLELTRLK